MSRTKGLLRDSSLLAISSIASKMLVLFLVPLYARVLSAEEYGIADLVNNITVMAYPVLTLSISEALFRYTLGKEEKSASAFTISLMIILASGLIVFAFAPASYIFGKSIENQWLWLSTFYITYSLNNMLISYARGLHLIKLVGIQGVLQTVITVTIAIVTLIVFKLGLNGYFSSLCIANLASILYMVIATKAYQIVQLRSLDSALIREMLKYCIPLIPTFISWWLINSIDKYFIIAMLGIGASGIYSIAHKIPSLILSLAEVFMSAFLISLIENKDDSKNAQYCSNAFRVFCFLLVLLGAVIIVSSDLWAGALFGEEFISAKHYLPPLILAAVVSAFASFFAAFFTLGKRTNILMVTTIIGAIVNIILNYILMPKMGMDGAAYATVISLAVLWVIRMANVNKVISLRLDYKLMLGNLILLVTLSVISSLEITYYKHITLALTACILIFNRKSIHEMITMVKEILHLRQKSSS